jgi:two-component system chemotaxis response regulator CheB
MPEFDGLAVVREVMREHPLPTIIISAGGFDETAAFEATRLGALEVATKPAYGDVRAEAALRESIRRVAAVPVIRHPGILPNSSKSPSTFQLRELVGGHRGTHDCYHPAPTVFGIGASAGGPPAVAALLANLPVALTPPVLVAQHMPRDHARAFARFLGSRCPLEVEVCSDSSRLKPGVVLIPDDGLDLALAGPDRAVAIPAQRSLTPSVDVLLESLALQWKERAAGAVLSGIGDDGTVGLGALRAAGGLTLVQDEASSAVYGMPRAAAPSACFQGSPEELATMLARERARLR